MPGVSIQRYFPTEDIEENNRLYKETQIQRVLERDVRKQTRECMLYDTVGDEEAFEKAAVKLKSKEAALKNHVDSSPDLHRLRDREQVVGFDKRISAKAVASEMKVVKTTESMYDIGDESDNIKAYYRDKKLRVKIQSDEINKVLEPGQYKKHVPWALEYRQYKEKMKRQGQFGPSYLTVGESEAQELVNKYAGTGILPRDQGGRWLNEEIITMHTDPIGIVVDNRNGNTAETTVFKIKYSPKGRGTHIILDYPSKKGAKGRK